MIEFLVLFLGVYGVLAVPHTSYVNYDHHQLENDAVIIDGQLPGTENLNEKTLPVSRLIATGTYDSPANDNLAEKSQISQQLPGTGNLAEKRIPDVVLKRLSEPSNEG